MWFPLATAIVFQAAVHLAHVGAAEVGYYLLVFVAFVIGLTLNFGMIAGYQCHADPR